MKASHVGASKAEAEKVWKDYLKRETSRKKAWLHHIPEDVDILNAAVKIREENLAAEEVKEQMAVTAKRDQENQIAQLRAKQDKEKHDAWCAAEGTRKGYCGCPLPPEAKTSAK